METNINYFKEFIKSYTIKNQLILVLSKNIFILNIFCFLVTLTITYALSHIVPSSAFKGTGKSLGVLSASFGAIPASYYIFREMNVRIVKNNIYVTTIISDILKFLIRNLKILHPICGVAMLYFSISHAYFFDLAGFDWLSSRMIFGAITTLGIFFLMITGALVKKYKFMNKYHLYIFIFSLCFFLMHLYIKFKF